MEIVGCDLPRKHFEEVYIVVCNFVVHVAKFGESEAPHDRVGEKVV